MYRENHTPQPHSPLPIPNLLETSTDTNFPCPQAGLGVTSLRGDGSGESSCPQNTPHQQGLVQHCGRGWDLGI